MPPNLLDCGVPLALSDWSAFIVGEVLASTAMDAYGSLLPAA
jgi:hypothetical protein